MGPLFQAQMAAIEEVMDEAQESINQPGVGFKGFVPAIFARMVNERFKEKVGDRAEIKVTAPAVLVRNRMARPDDWEVPAHREAAAVSRLAGRAGVLDDGAKRRP